MERPDTVAVDVDRRRATVAAGSRRASFPRYWPTFLSGSPMPPGSDGCWRGSWAGPTTPGNSLPRSSVGPWDNSSPATRAQAAEGRCWVSETSLSMFRLVVQTGGRRLALPFSQEPSDEPFDDDDHVVVDGKVFHLYTTGWTGNLVPWPDTDASTAH